MARQPFAGIIAHGSVLDKLNLRRTRRPSGSHLDPCATAPCRLLAWCCALAHGYSGRAPALPPIPQPTAAPPPPAPHHHPPTPSTACGLARGEGRLPGGGTRLPRALPSGCRGRAPQGGGRVAGHASGGTGPCYSQAGPRAPLQAQWMQMPSDTSRALRASPSSFCAITDGPDQ
jgi:hypothetical protein